jgi:hypothetical protein
MTSPQQEPTVPSPRGPTGQPTHTPRAIVREALQAYQQITEDHQRQADERTKLLIDAMNGKLDEVTKAVTEALDRIAQAIQMPRE